MSGPSPRVWGIHWSRRNNYIFDRSIPTRVGNTHISFWFRSSVAVHPHACGEYDLVEANLRAMGGPSPRVWGIQFVVVYVYPWPRSIPTRVGNTKVDCIQLLDQRSIPTRVGNTLS